MEKQEPAHSTKAVEGCCTARTSSVRKSNLQDEGGNANLQGQALEQVAHMSHPKQENSGDWVPKQGTMAQRW